jgi:hypothetical protein
VINVTFNAVKPLPSFLKGEQKIDNESRKTIVAGELFISNYLGSSV